MDTVLSRHFYYRECGIESEVIIKKDPRIHLQQYLRSSVTAIPPFGFKVSNSLTAFTSSSVSVPDSNPKSASFSRS
jgi:hypothetical protein